MKEKTQMKVEELIGLEKELYPILEMSQLSRDDDMKLYGNYVERQWQKKKVYTLAEYITEVMLNADFRKEQEIRPFCTVERVRRKLQEKYPELRGKKYRPRNKEQETYKEYARESCYFKGNLSISNEGITAGPIPKSYITLRNRDLIKIAELVEEHPDEEIYYGNNWIRIAGRTLNGFTKEFIKNYLQTLKY